MGVHLKTQCDKKYFVAFYIINYKQKRWQQVKKKLQYNITVVITKNFVLSFCWTKKSVRKNLLIEYNKL